MIWVPRPSAAALLSCDEVPGESVSSCVKFRVERGNSFTAEPSTTRPSAVDSVCSMAEFAETSIFSLTPAGCNTASTAMRSVTGRVAVRVCVVNPETENCSS